MNRDESTQTETTRGIEETICLLEEKGFSIHHDAEWAGLGIGDWVVQAPDGRVAVRWTAELEKVLANRDEWVRA